MKDMREIVNDYVSEEKLSFEGTRGMKSLNQLAADLGYQRDGFEFGSSLERFLEDNPGAQEAIIEWISEQELPEWKESLANAADIALDDTDDEREEDHVNEPV